MPTYLPCEVQPVPKSERPVLLYSFINKVQLQKTTTSPILTTRHNRKWPSITTSQISTKVAWISLDHTVHKCERFSHSHSFDPKLAHVACTRHCQNMSVKRYVIAILMFRLLDTAPKMRTYVSRQTTVAWFTQKQRNKTQLQSSRTDRLQHGCHRGYHLQLSRLKRHDTGVVCHNYLLWFVRERCRNHARIDKTEAVWNPWNFSGLLEPDSHTGSENLLCS